jgi:hypothetical protein
MKIESSKLKNAAKLIYDKADWGNSYRGFEVQKCEKEKVLLVVHCTEKPLVAFIFNNSSMLHIICKENDKYIPCAVNIIDLLDSDYNYFGKLVNDNYDIVFCCNNQYRKRLRNIGIHNNLNDELDDEAVYFV